jgi:hypothetical protein
MVKIKIKNKLQGNQFFFIGGYIEKKNNFNKGKKIKRIRVKLQNK